MIFVKPVANFAMSHINMPCDVMCCLDIQNCLHHGYIAYMKQVQNVPIASGALCFIQNDKAGEFPEKLEPVFFVVQIYDYFSHSARFRCFCSIL